MSRIVTTKKFIEKAKDIHGNKYIYSKVIYVNHETKVEIICKIHGSFFQTTLAHTCRKSGCPECGKIKKSKSNTRNTAEFIYKAKIIHGDLYDYSISKYEKATEKIDILCKKHGIFQQSPNTHLRGSGCPPCGFEKIKKSRALSLKMFKKRANKIHKNKYNYNLVSFGNSQSKIKIICPVHGVFNQYVKHHLRGHGCQSCLESKGEKRIKEFLNRNKLTFNVQEQLPVDGKRRLKFDFYLKEYDLFIEYQGEQHYRPVDFFGGVAAFNALKKRDQFKRDWCKENNHNLLEIKYTDFNNIEEIMTENIYLS